MEFNSVESVVAFGVVAGVVALGLGWCVGRATRGEDNRGSSGPTE